MMLGSELYSPGPGTPFPIFSLDFPLIEKVTAFLPNSSCLS
jgi:hypothetical protein